MSTETVHFLGTGGFHPTESRHTSCYLLQESGIVLDAGTGMFRLRDRMVGSELDILLSHVHLDHCQGLTYLLDVLWDRPIERVQIHARPEDLRVVRERLFDSPLFPVPCQYELVPLQSGLVLRGWKVEIRMQEHPGGSVGLRLTRGDSSIAYITDTTADPNDEESVDFVRNVNLLLHECYFDDSWEELARKSGHSTATAVAQLAAKANVQKLVLTHANPIADDHQLKEMLQTVRTTFPFADFAHDLTILQL